MTYGKYLRPTPTLSHWMLARNNGTDSRKRVIGRAWDAGETQTRPELGGRAVDVKECHWTYRPVSVIARSSRVGTRIITPKMGVSGVL